MLHKFWVDSLPTSLLYISILLVKVFASPNMNWEIGETYAHLSQIMGKTLHEHPHIGMCRAACLENTKDAIDIFVRVAQMGS